MSNQNSRRPQGSMVQSDPMLSECAVIGFVPTKDAARARAFYVDTLHLLFESDDQFALVVRANGTMIRIVRMQEFTPAPFTTLGWAVADIEKEVAELLAAGVQFLRIPQLPQDASGIWTTPNGSKVAWVHDPDGNVLSVSQHF
jgi:catechol 2,3-dioxygenase-like lactoylglutathione lyase family enzyme